MGHPITTTVTLGAAVANGIAQTQSLGGAGNLTLNGSLVSGGVATMDAPRRVIIASLGNDSGITFTITGTARPEQGGIVQSEVVTGANIGTVVSTLDYATVTSIRGSGATASTVTAGTNTTGSGPWVVWDSFISPMKVALAGFVLSGTPGWQLDYTYDDPFGTWLPPGIAAPRPFTDSLIVGLNINQQGYIDFPVRATRLTLTGVGSAQLTQQQAGN